MAYANGHGPSCSAALESSSNPWFKGKRSHCAEAAAVKRRGFRRSLVRLFEDLSASVVMSDLQASGQLSELPCRPPLPPLPTTKFRSDGQAPSSGHAPTIPGMFLSHSPLLLLSTHTHSCPYPSHTAPNAPLTPLPPNLFALRSYRVAPPMTGD